MALAIGGCTVAELQQRMSSREFARWMAYDQIEPIGDHRADVLTALLASVVANTVPRKKGAKAFTPNDFLPRWPWEAPGDGDGEQLGQVQQQRLLAFAQALVRATGGRDLRQQQQRGNRGDVSATERHSGTPG